MNRTELIAAELKGVPNAHIAAQAIERWHGESPQTAEEVAAIAESPYGDCLPEGVEAPDSADTGGASPAPPADVAEAIKTADAPWLKQKVAYTSNPLRKGPEWVKAYKERPVQAVLASIAKPPKARAEAVAAIRAHDDGSAEQEAAKKKLPSVVFAGRIEGDQRVEANFVDHTGIAFFDYEFDKDANDAAKMRDDLFADEHVAAAWVSSSGKGVHGIVRFERPPADKPEHTASYKAAKAKMAERLQGSFDNTSDRVRFAFLSHDPNLRFRADSKPFPLVKAEPPAAPVEDVPPAFAESVQQAFAEAAPQRPLKERVQQALNAIDQGLVGGPYTKGKDTYTEASTLTWALSQFVDGDATVMAAWMAKLDGDGRFGSPEDRRNFEAKWRGEGKFKDIGAGSFVHKVRKESKRLGKKSPMPTLQERLTECAEQFVKLVADGKQPPPEIIEEAIKALGNEAVDVGDERKYMRLLQEHIPDDEAASKAFVNAATKRIQGIVQRRQAEERAAEDAAKVAAFIADKPESSGPTIHTGAKLAEKPPKREWIVDEWIPTNRVTLLTGMGEAGKSRLALQLAEAIASGHEEFIPGNDGEDEKSIPVTGGPDAEGVKLSLDRKPCHVVYATWEDEEAEMRRRLQPMVRDEKTAGYDNLHIAECIGHGPLWQPGGDDEEASKHTSVMGGRTWLAEHLRMVCESVGAKLLVLDTLAAVYMCNENDRGLVRAFMSDLDEWAIDTGCAVLLIAHPSKGGKGNVQAAYSGSTDWHGAVRSLVTLGKADLPPSPEEVAAAKDGKQKVETQKALRLTLEKSNYGWAGKEVWLGRFDGRLCAMRAKTAAENLENAQWNARGRTNYK